MEEKSLQKSENLQVELHSQEVHEILSYIPHWIIRWGIGLILGAVVLILSGTWFIKYPEVIPAEITITSQNPPMAIITRAAGNINLLVKNGSLVHKGDVLGFIETSANYRDVSKLNNFISKLNTSNDSIRFAARLDGLEKLSSLNLGEIQNAYGSFYQHAQSLLVFKQIDYYRKNINQISNRIGNYQRLNEELRNQKEIFEAEYKISSKQMAKDSLLYQRGAISEVELNNARLSLLQAQRAKQNANINIVNNQLRINELKGQITELKLQAEQEQRQLTNAVLESLELLKSAIAAWEEQYVLKAPDSGKVTFFSIRNDNVYIDIREKVMSVIPQGEDFFGLLQMPIANSGKVEVGQRVNIKLSNYPYQQFGMLVGKIKQISLVPTEGFYFVYVSFPQGLKTTYGITLEFKQKMKGSAEIVTEDYRLLERIFAQLRKVFDQI